MAKLKIYGITQSRAARNLWMARELGIPFEQVQTGFDATNTPEFLAVNPMGQLPAIDDGGFKLSESMAINLYLSRKHGKLWPATLEDEARTYQWSFWVMTAVEPYVLKLLLQRFKFREYPAAELEEATKTLQRPLGVIDKYLAGKTWMVGGAFSVADVNVASVMAWVRGAKMDIAAYPNFAAWLERCLARPAFKG